MKADGGALDRDLARRLGGGARSGSRIVSWSRAQAARLGIGRLRRGRLTVVDATNVRARERNVLLALARVHRRPAVAIVFDLPLRTCLEGNLRRTDRVVPREIVRVQHRRMRLALARMKAEGFAKVFVFHSAKEADMATIACR